MKILFIVLLAAVFAAGGCGKPAAPGTIPFDLHADSLGVEPMPENAKLAANLDKAHDGLESTRWTTFGPMRNGYFVEMTFDGAPEVSELIFDARPSGLDYPREFTVELVNPDGDWENLGFYDESTTDDGITTVTFDNPREAQRLVIRLTSDANFWWSIHEISVR
ncbi:MAG: discoidin domain-containing protein [Candidatus Coatesbacteria bacterium]|nr:MAG: discoidin domain-containing protein [Candidatus Coatesbacteria bacterium]